MRMFQIREDDLAELERTIPNIIERMYVGMDNRTRVQSRRLQAILSSVRWNYGPPSETIVMDADRPTAG